MVITELIDQLQKIMEIEGNIEILASDPHDYGLIQNTEPKVILMGSSGDVKKVVIEGKSILERRKNETCNNS